MTIFITGASGATGKLLVERLIQAGHQVKIIVRPGSNIPDTWNNHDKITVIRAVISEMNTDQLAAVLADCQAVASCLGHTPNLKGIYGKPRKLVTNAVALLCNAILNSASGKPVKFVLMNTAGNSNRDLKEPVSWTQKIVISLVRLLVPPHADNENAADYLRVKIGQQHPAIEWVAVRPDTLTDAAHTTAYSIRVSPPRNALFQPGKTSRINVAHFMAQLITDEEQWNRWKGQMPVIYNENV
ncbi:NAD(P)-dependent oxidoreductase [Chitinophaga qingshengii]|uniref:SDR family oxidoreductase n=1 Tax=Chitinophaga qingshengii TaxID=1569794 RepID=A0ABR7TQM7_9BACT|nr:NAD(P)-binding oxidoreductase [Chitinophaga qingshengii]MBC9932781.1 SDR family oxidoreductase [Chitinophaga qingshengii]